MFVLPPSKLSQPVLPMTSAVQITSAPSVLSVFCANLLPFCVKYAFVDSAWSVNQVLASWIASFEPVLTLSSVWVRKDNSDFVFVFSFWEVWF